eukprot:scaffold22014_cov123-Isochrysis_galbana.AAC.2
MPEGGRRLGWHWRAARPRVGGVCLVPNAKRATDAAARTVAMGRGETPRTHLQSGAEVRSCMRSGPREEGIAKCGDDDDSVDGAIRIRCDPGARNAIAYGREHDIEREDEKGDRLDGIGHQS